MDPVEALRREREALEQRIRDIDRAIQEYEAWAQRWRGVLLGHTSREEPVLAAPPAEPAPSVVGGSYGEAADPAPIFSKRSTPVAEFESKALDLLSEVGEPLNRSQFLEQIEERGVVIGGAEPKNTLSARLSRMREVTNLKGFGYWLRSRPYEPAGYQPSEEPVPTEDGHSDDGNRGFLD